MIEFHASVGANGIRPALDGNSRMRRVRLRRKKRMNINMSIAL